MFSEVAMKKTIYCPKCNRRVAEYDGRSSSNVIVNCKNCKKRIVYHVDNGETEIKPIPPRESASGMVFY